MLTYEGGLTVGKGTYWDVASGRRIDVSGEAVLAAGTAHYVRMSSGAMLMSGACIGFLYSLLMPFIGIAAVAAVAARLVLGTLYRLAAKSISFGWRPQNAILSGKKKTGGAKK